MRKEIWLFFIWVIFFSFANMFISNMFIPFSNNEMNKNIYIEKHNISDNIENYYYIYKKCYWDNKLKELQQKIGTGYNYNNLLDEWYNCNNIFYQTFPYVYNWQNIYYINNSNLSKSSILSFWSDVKSVIIFLFYLYLNFQYSFINIILVIINILFVIGFIYYMYYVINIKDDINEKNNKKENEDNNTKK